MPTPDRSDHSVRVIIKGRVQGVWYRGWTVETAQALGLCGWVRNLGDGSVEAIFSGPERDVDAMLAHCHQGPRAARVQSVTAEDWLGPVRPDFRQVP
ncbi:MAG: acylphosphatase [Rhodospirillaceae bacterium]|jgi:acylphosphatase|nr:acylphosphatase [Rhodospirillaceae bacterium]MBT3494398.1 acylphosphatase [Rhodospirillaceae bacterium]MBT3781303.1 acylphosphatase [Rhodospirillaceae bacterium]MBT3978776.1 acylphosphatase [Rhodospirillaceae bacterium]MBT4169723.1 acylphosphatase [Rhodospirillaceae bacterium]